MIFLVDAQLPPALARALSELGHDAIHVMDIGLDTASDRTIWKQAVERGAVIITKDEDFVGSGPDRFGVPAPPVVWIRFGNVSRKALLQRFLPLLPKVIELIGKGEAVVEIRDL